MISAFKAGLFIGGFIGIVAGVLLAAALIWIVNRYHVTW